MGILGKIKDRLGFGSGYEDYADEYGDEYVEIDTQRDVGRDAKILVKTFVIQDFEDIKQVLDALRLGTTIALINIRPLKDRDLVELKRTINKIKKTCEAIEGDIAGVSEDWIVVTPAFAQIYRSKETEELAE